MKGAVMVPFLLFLPVESHAFLVFEINIVDFYHKKFEPFSP